MWSSSVKCKIVFNLVLSNQGYFGEVNAIWPVQCSSKLMDSVLGYDLGGIQVDSGKVQCIVDYPIPKTLQKARRFLGTCGSPFHRRFIVDFSEKNSSDFKSDDAFLDYRWDWKSDYLCQPKINSNISEIWTVKESFKN